MNRPASLESAIARMKRLRSRMRDKETTRPDYLYRTDGNAMATQVIMPAQGMSQETVRLVQWLKQEEERVTKGEA